MGHSVLIGGTAYEITCGRTLIGGTGYDVTCGRTFVNGTGYDVGFGSGGNSSLGSIEDVLVDFAYTPSTTNPGMYEITDWNGTTNGVSSTELIIPDDPRIIV